MKRTILLIVAATLLTLPAMSSVRAASIYVTQRLFGGVIIHIDGVINLSDEQDLPASPLSTHQAPSLNLTA